MGIEKVVIACLQETRIRCMDSVEQDEGAVSIDVGRELLAMCRNVKGGGPGKPLSGRHLES